MAHPRARLGAITKLQAMHRQGEPSRTPISPTFEQLLREGEATRWSAPARSSQILGKQHDMEDDHIIHAPPRKSNSVLAKFKEKAKKWRNSLSRKKHSGDGNTTPSWGVSVDEEDEDEDSEYLGAPMYESEMAPQGYKETGKKHPRAISFIPDNRVYTSNVISSKNVHNSANSLAESMFQIPALSPIETQKRSLDRTPKSAPAIVSLSPIMVSSHPPMPSPHAEAVIAPSLPTIATKQGELSPEEFCKVSPSSGPAKVATSYQHSTSKQLWDRGVSVKEYIMQKLEPGEDEKALSQVISDAISPSKTPSDATVVEKVKEAVSSLLLNQESPRRTAYHSAQNSSTHFPISTNDHEVVEEENTLGRILQYN